ncbi:MAG: KH domain-containing protein, partial [Clostridia bacterium]|nr:KH domain-containing protein [Clostridia bacterium]
PLPLDENDAAANYLRTIITGMGIEEVEITLAKEENENEYIYTVNCGREDGALIGRRGETLDAIQYLLRLSINKGLSDDKHRKVSVNVGNYREKRNENLRQLAAKSAKSVLKYGRNVALEPMNPYERRIIHTAIQQIDGVTSFSTGVDSGRRVIIALEEGVTPTNPSKGGGYNKRDNYRGGNRGGGRGGDRRGGGGGYRKKEAYQPAVTREPRKDSAGSLYGKIEIPQNND